MNEKVESKVKAGHKASEVNILVDEMECRMRLKMLERKTHENPSHVAQQQSYDGSQL
jgi:hypothetical protein